LFLVLREGLTLGVLGVSLGVAGALVVSRILGSMLYGTGVADPITYSAVSGMFLAIAMAASYVPARRAARLDPMAALRWE
jgi:ABC-type antimicrobial peptide transport system permease subunit